MSESGPPLLNGAELKKAEPRYVKSVITDVEKYQHEPSLKHKCCRDQAGFQKSLQTFTITEEKLSFLTNVATKGDFATFW